MNPRRFFLRRISKRLLKSDHEERLMTFQSYYAGLLTKKYIQKKQKISKDRERSGS